MIWCVPVTVRKVRVERRNAKTVITVATTAVPVTVRIVRVIRTSAEVVISVATTTVAVSVRKLIVFYLGAKIVISVATIIQPGVSSMVVCSEHHPLPPTAWSSRPSPICRTMRKMAVTLTLGVLGVVVANRLYSLSQQSTRTSTVSAKSFFSYCCGEKTKFCS